LLPSWFSGKWLDPIEIWKIHPFFTGDYGEEGNNKTNNRVHFIYPMLPQRLRFFPPLGPFGIPRQRQAQVGDGRQTRAFHLLVSDLQKASNQDLEPFPFSWRPFGKLLKKTRGFFGFFADFFLGIHQN